MAVVSPAISTDSYLSIFLSRPAFEIWTLFLLGLARIVPTIALAPFLGGKTIPDTLKLMFGISIVFIFLPFLVLHSKTVPQMDVFYLFLLVKEVVIGSILGFFIAMPFYFSQSAGALIDHQRGAQSLQVMDPTTMMQTSPTGTLYNNIMLVAFFWIGAVPLFFEAIFTSYTVIPADQFFPPDFFDANKPLWIVLIGIITKIVSISLQLSAPSIIAMLLSDLFLGIANRMAPQVQISFLMWSLKAYVGVAMLWVAWWLVLKQIDIQALNWTKTFQRLVETMG